MSNLNAEALKRLKEAGISETDWARVNDFPNGVWGGDACGCPDDRCIGFHHDENSECQCLPVWLDEYWSRA